MTPHLGQAALNIDAFLHQPHAAATIQACRDAAQAAGYGHLLDQADAAADHATAVTTAAARQHGATHINIHANSQPEWIRLTILETLVKWIAGKADTCPHSPTPVRPQPVIAAAWRPGLVACARCPHLLRLRPGSAKDRTCDGCGTVVFEAGELWAATIVYGPLSFSFGACGACRFWPPEAAVPLPRAGAGR